MRRAGRAVAAALAILSAAPQAGAGQDSPRAVPLGSYSWTGDLPGFGGFSGIELTQDGRGFVALSDRGYLLRGTVARDAGGRITGIDTGPAWELLTSRGRRLHGIDRDSEGLALAPDGSLYVSFEGNVRIARYTAPGAPAELLPRPPEFGAMQANAALEALAIDAAGTLYTLPEDSPEAGGGFPVWRFRGGLWDRPFSIPRDGSFLPVGADIGPDGRLYLLERRLGSILGFSSRVRRFDLAGGGIGPGVTLMETAPGTHGNLEGIAVWQDAAGAIRLTLIADNNQLPFFADEIADYRVE